MNVEYIAEEVGHRLYCGLVIDMESGRAILRTNNYVSAETAKSAAASMWRAKVAKMEMAA